MNNERETITVIAPVSKFKIVLNTYVTGLEKRQLRNVFINEETTKMEQLNTAEDLTWKTVVVSVDGSSEDIVNKILGLDAVDTNFITEEVNKIITLEKKTS